MEFNESHIEPRSSNDLLYQQVQEQSDLCDVTVTCTAKKWSKKFHWCVLVESPFFLGIRRNGFLESQTGIVNINIASPLTIEIAILFLYGKRPNITEDNVSNLMEISEFLMIPNLKAACVRYAKLIRITDDNCIRMMELSTLYEFEFFYCFEYVRAHLSDLLARNDALNLTTEFLIHLLSDPLLIYVTAEERFTFLLKWIKHHPQRERDFNELFDLIDIDDMEPGFFEKEVCNHPVITRLRPNLPSLCEKSSSLRRVLLFSGHMVNDRIICFDLEKHRLIAIQTSLSNYPDNYSYFSHDSYKSVYNNETSYVFEVERNSNCKRYTVFRHNLAKNEVLEIPVLTEFTYARIKLDSMNTLVLANDSSQRNKLVSVVSGVTERQHSGIRFAEVSVGELNFPESSLRPVITIRNAEVRCICTNSNNVVAMVTFRFEKMYLYDIDNGTLDIVQVGNNLEFEDKSMLIGYKDGFIFHNHKTALIISRLSGPALDRRYLTKPTSLEICCHPLNKRYYFCDRMWYRFETGGWEKGIDLACLSHEELMSEKNRKWEKLCSLQSSRGIFEKTQLLKVSLPKSMLKCHIYCPHCKVRK